MTDARKVEIAELAEVMKSPSGRNVILRILKHNGLFSRSFDENPYVHAHRAGAREEGVWLMNELKVATPAELQTLIKGLFDNG